MADGVVKVQSAPGGDKGIDNTELVVGANTVERQRVQLAGAAAAELADVRNAAPGANDLGLVTRPIPSGTQTVAGTVATTSAAASQADGHSATIGATTDTSAASTLVGLLKKLASLLPAALVGGRLDVNIGATAVTQPVSGTVTTTPPANASTNVAQVGGGALSLGQKAGANSIPVVLPNDGQGATQAGASFVQPRQLVTYTAIYRLGARPYALSNVFAAAGRKQYATIHHTAGATKTVKIKRVEVALESGTVAGLVVADLVRITTAPATGNPAITPSAQNPGDAAAEAVCLALPTTAGTEAGVQSMQEWNLGITGAGSTVNPPPGLNWYTLWPQTQGAPEASEDKYPTMRAATLEGYAVTLDASVAETVKGFVVIEFTEE